MYTHSVIILGDLNARVGNLDGINNKSYNINPDTTINQNGKELKKILNDFNNVTVINGLQYDGRSFVSNFTF